MKMFSWMHHKFRTNTGYELLAQRKDLDDDGEAVAPSSFKTLEGEAKALLVLENAELVLLEELHEGFLAMGTTSSSAEKSGELEAAGVDRDQAKGRRFGAPFPSDFVYKQWESMDQFVGSSQAHAELGWAGDDMDTVALLHDVVRFWIEEEGEKEIGGERIRTTLAELFSRRESVYFPGEMKGGRADGGAMKEMICLTRPGLDVTTEPIGAKGGETEPSIKLHKVQITASKLLKRKVHPEMEREKLNSWVGKNDKHLNQDGRL